MAEKLPFLAVHPCRLTVWRIPATEPSFRGSAR